MQKPNAPLTIDFDLFDSKNLLRLRHVKVILKENGTDVTNVVSNGLGQGTFNLNAPLNKDSYY